MALPPTIPMAAGYHRSSMSGWQEKAYLPPAARKQPREPGISVGVRVAYRFSVGVMHLFQTEDLLSLVMIIHRLNDISILIFDISEPEQSIVFIGRHSIVDIALTGYTDQREIGGSRQLCSERI